MFAPSIPVMAAWANAGILLAAGLVNLVGSPRLHEIYSEYDIPAGYYRTIGVAEIFAALFLVTPELRVWGILLATPIMFLSVVMLLDHERYEYAGLVALFLVGLVAATLAVPSIHAGHATELPTHFVVNTAAHQTNRAIPPHYLDRSDQDLCASVWHLAGCVNGGDGMDCIGEYQLCDVLCRPLVATTRTCGPSR